MVNFFIWTYICTKTQMVSPTPDFTKEGLFPFCHCSLYYRFLDSITYLFTWLLIHPLLKSISSPYNICQHFVGRETGRCPTTIRRLLKDLEATGMRGTQLDSNILKLPAHCLRIPRLAQFVTCCGLRDDFNQSPIWLPWILLWKSYSIKRLHSNFLKFYHEHG